MEVDLSGPLQKLKEEIDSLEVKIVGLNDGMHTLKPYVEEFHQKKDKKKELIRQKREKLRELKIISNFYKQATGQEPDAIYPLFNQTA